MNEKRFINPTTGAPCTSKEMLEWFLEPMTEEEIRRGGFRYGPDGKNLWADE